MRRCIEMTMNGRCPQTYFVPVDQPEVERCYYHQKVVAGLTSTAETIGLIEEDEG